MHTYILNIIIRIYQANIITVMIHTHYLYIWEAGISLCLYKFFRKQFITLSTRAKASSGYSKNLPPSTWPVVCQNLPCIMWIMKSGM